MTTVEYRVRAALLVLAVMLGSRATAESQGEVLPVPSEAFGGKVGMISTDSVAQYPRAVSAPAGAPNILLVMTDDVGFGAASAFGGPIPTPSLERLAMSGVRFNSFNTAAMCSPSRAALLTGRNPHVVSAGSIVDLSSGFPGYWARIPRSAATVARILRDGGYNTAMFGKHHNVPREQGTPTGPFDLWPAGLGFEYFYGFIGGAMNQFDPRLVEGTTFVDLARRPADYFLERDLTDHVIGWIHNQKANAPDRPFFVYYAPGTAHSPVQAPREWIARFRGQFDMGWDRLREQTLARQKALGIVPASTDLTARPEQIPAWTDMDAAERAVSARHMEVYAAMLAFQDAQFGRILDELKRMGILETTLIVFVEGDNGGSMEGGLDGTLNEAGSMANGLEESLPQRLARLDQFGGRTTMEAYPAGWGWALNAPFQWSKQVASHLGGVRNGMVVAWHGHVARPGSMRWQYAYITDIMPTLLDAAGVRAPRSVDGVAQLPIDGISFTYTFNDPDVGTRRREQLYELFGNRALYQDGWLASTTPRRMPWDYGPMTGSPLDYQWELYYLPKDFSQAQNLAGQEPGRLAEMQRRWTELATVGDVFPLNDSFVGRNQHTGEVPRQAVSSFTYWGGDVSVAQAAAPQLSGRSFRVSAQVNVPVGGGDGVLLATGSHFGGWSFYLQHGRPMVYAARSEVRADQFRVASRKRLTAGPARIDYEFSYDGGGAGRGGTLRILLDGHEVAQGRIDRTVNLPAGFAETLDIGRDTGAPVSPDYVREGAFSGRIERIDIRLDPPAR